MALNRFNPFVFPSAFDDFFEPPTTFFPRDLATFGPRTAVTRDSQQQQQFWRHPGYEVHDDDKNYMVSVDVPGVRPEDMTISVEDNTLHVTGGRKVKKDGQVSESKFDYRLSMGDCDVEKVTAHLDNGVLQLTAPKKVPVKPEPRAISITAGPSPRALVEEKKEEA